jgi:hypothetical protein
MGFRMTKGEELLLDRLQGLAFDYGHARPSLVVAETLKRLYGELGRAPTMREVIRCIITSGNLEVAAERKEVRSRAREQYEVCEEAGEATHGRLRMWQRFLNVFK